ncbi:MAG TPA: DUF3857 and transglutaminase domain-containing protein [Pyrinomonadaceae bacterium]|nr:DUF3857 and transglutaminase domain-containing protein [Pyrinomonadaceae bacterium]
MFLPRFLPTLFLTLVCLLVLSTPLALADDNDWKPVDPAELSSTTPVVEPNADAEAIFWEVRMDDSQTEDLIFKHYIRIKVFTERGREAQSKVDIPFGKISHYKIRIEDIAARTIRPDGTIIELKKSDIFERTIVKANGVKIKAKSFAMPGVEPGSIIEYRWREVRENQSANNVRLEFQRDIPVRSVKYYLKPFANGETMRVQTFHGNSPELVKERNGFYSVTMTNMKPVHEEPNMPPEDQVKTWMLLYYTPIPTSNPAIYWGLVSKAFDEIIKPLMKADDRVKQTAATAIGDATTPEQKLQRLYEYVRANVKNTSDDASGLTAEDRLKLKSNKSPSDTIKRGQGTGQDIDLLFGALAKAAGFDVRVALAPDRNQIFFSPEFSNLYFVEPSSVAVKVGDVWRFFNPGYNLLPFGMLRWQEEGEETLLVGESGALWVKTPMSPPELSRVTRKAKLRLLEDGTLEGDVRMEYTGHLAIEKKEENDEDSPQQREDTLREMIKSHMSTAELSNIQIENVTDPAKPFVYAFHIRVPGYAQKTGRRLFLQPAFFQHGFGALFQTSDRTYPVYFHFPWSEDDNVEIELPGGYALDHAEAPAPMSAGNVSAYNVKIQVADEHTILYHRTFFFGGGESILFPTTTYSAIKQVFDAVHTSDEHTLALRQGATASN